MKNNILSFLIAAIILVAASCSQKQPVAELQPASYVNNYTGTDGPGNTFPGATVPFGMVQISPDTRWENWDGSSGYHYSDSTIMGFSQTHLSGTGAPEYCDVLLMPTNGELQILEIPLRAYLNSSSIESYVWFY